MQLIDLQRLQAARAMRQRTAVVTFIATGEQAVVSEPGEADPEVRELVADAFRRDLSGTHKLSDGREVFISVQNPPLRMVMIGAVHISQALIPLAKSAGYDVTVVDPRTAFATADRFAGITLDARWPDEALPAIGLDRRTAFIALTHDPKIDDPALMAALASDVFYIGALGSKKTNAARRGRLATAGLSDVAIDRIHAPIGLDIGAVGASEIAISIMAEVTAVLRGKTGRA